MPKLYGLAHNPIYAKHKPFEEMTNQEYADWYVDLGRNKNLLRHQTGAHRLGGHRTLRHIKRRA